MPLLTLPQATEAQTIFPTAAVGAARWAVEFSPTTNPTDQPVWVDITDRVRSISIARGRQRQLDRFEAGTATVVLSNADRLFDPAYTAGTYYGGLLPMRRFRIRAQDQETTVDGTIWVTRHRYHGFAENWKQEYDRSNNEAVCVVTLADAFKVLALSRPSSPFANLIGSEGPDCWYRLSEASGTAMRDSSEHARDGSYSGSITYNQAGLIGSDDNGCMQLAGSGYAYSDAVPPRVSNVAVECWFSTTEASAQTLLCYGATGSSNALIRISLDATGHLLFAYLLGGVTYLRTTSAVYNDGDPHHVAIVVNDGPPYFYMEVAADGAVPAYSISTIANITTTSSRLSVGATDSGTGQFTGKIDEVAAWVDAANPYDAIGPLAGHYAAGATPYAGDGTGTQAGIVLDGIGIPDSERDIDTGNSTAQAIDYGGMSALDYLQALAVTEQGLFYQGADGKIVFRERHATVGDSSSWTFADTDPYVRFSDLTFSYDDSLIRNSVIAQRVGGGEVTVRDATSVDTYYERTYTQTGLLYDDDNQTRDFAQWIVNRYKDPALRVETMTIRPDYDPTGLAYIAAFELELGALITVIRTPQGVGDPITRDVIVEGIRETVVPGGPYEITFAISEADTASYWILGDSTYSVLGTTTRLAF